MRALGWVNLTHEDDRAASREWVTAVLDGRRPQPLEKRYLRKDGDILWAAVDASFAACRPNTVGLPASYRTSINVPA